MSKPEQVLNLTPPTELRFKGKCLKYSSRKSVKFARHIVCWMLQFLGIDRWWILWYISVMDMLFLSQNYLRSLILNLGAAGCWWIWGKAKLCRYETCQDQTSSQVTGLWRDIICPNTRPIPKYTWTFYADVYASWPSLSNVDYNKL